MENSKQEEQLKDAIRISGSEELAKQLIAASKSVIEEYYKEQVELLKQPLINVRVKVAELSKDLTSKDARNALLGLIGGIVVDEMVAILLVHACEASVLSKTRMSDFIYQALRIFETSAVENTITSMKSNIMDMVLRIASEARPEPSKENLS